MQASAEDRTTRSASGGAEGSCGSLTDGATGHSAAALRAPALTVVKLDDLLPVQPRRRVLRRDDTCRLRQCGEQGDGAEGSSGKDASARPLDSTPSHRGRPEHKTLNTKLSYAGESESVLFGLRDRRTSCGVVLSPLSLPETLSSSSHPDSVDASAPYCTSLSSRRPRRRPRRACDAAQVARRGPAEGRCR